MLPTYSFSQLKRITILFTIVSLVVASLGTSFFPLLSPAIGQDAQNTDLFTGQFIPAYLGAAYDPSEAYKQMAGLPVYVYAYDTADKIINNYIYKTQVRADGSFQAAGLANASHYGVCIPVNDNGRFVSDGVTGDYSPFRAPITGAGGDALEGVFAFNEGLYPRTPINPHNQAGNEVELSNVNAGYQPNPPDADHQGCRTFFTSNKTVDIANHVNIFPLVPTTVLSVLINDSSPNRDVKDPFNVNTPYEVYAQRIAVTSSACPAPTSSDPTAPSCSQASTAVNAVVANGPIIRGRTVPVQSTSNNQTSIVATIFQAYAPPGIYAITYWRPDTRDTKSAVTYLSYDGSESINSPYNGIAFENVVNAGGFVAIKAGASGGAATVDSNQWKLASRDPGPDSHFAWFPQPGNLNIWGLLTTASFGSSVPVNSRPIATVGNSWFGFLDPSTRTCTGGSGGSPSGQLPTWGIYLFSTSCTNNTGFFSSTTSEISIAPSVSAGLGSEAGNAAATAANSAGSAAAGGANATQQATSDTGHTPINFDGIDNQSISASGDSGPSRRDFSLGTTPNNGVSMRILKNGLPVASTSFGMVVDGKPLYDIASTDTNGRLVIPGVYFKDGNPQQYRVFASEGGSLLGATTANTLAFTIDGSSLKNPTLALNNLGNVDMDGNLSPIGGWLAQLNLANLASRVHIATPVFAASRNDSLNKKDIQLWLDMSVIHGINNQKWFTYSNYDLSQVEIVYPDDVVSSLNIGNSSYVIFNRYTHIDGNHAALGDSSKNGMITSLDGQQALNGSQTQAAVDQGQNPEIVGIEMTLKELEPDNGDMAQKLDDVFQRYQITKAANTSYKGTMPLTVRVTFTKHETTKTTTTDGVGDVTDDPTAAGQDQSQTDPPQLSADWPIILQDTTKGRDYTSSQPPYSYTVAYDPIALTVEPPGCHYGSGIISAIKNAPKQFFCSSVSGIISMVGWTTKFIANNLITVNPLQFSVTRDGWNVLRNFVNGFATLILVIYGIAIMLRYEPQTYNLRQLMTKLISTILLVNFSILIIQAGIDLANVFSSGGYYFMLQALASSGAISSTGIQAAIAGMVALSAAAFSIVVFMPGPAVLAALIIIFALLAGLVVIMFKAVFYWLLRQIILVICIVVAPVALVARIIPSTQSYYAKWKSLLISTLVNQILFAFVLALAMGILQASARGSNGVLLAMVEIGIAAGLFWYSTKFPQKAQAAFESASGVAVGNLLKGTASQFKKAGLKTWEMRLERDRRNERNRRREEELGITGRSAAYRKWRLSTDSMKQGMNKMKEQRLHAQEEGREDQLKTATLDNKMQNLHEFEAVEENDYQKKRDDMHATVEEALMKASATDEMAFRRRQEYRDRLSNTTKQLAEDNVKMNHEWAYDQKREEGEKDAVANAMEDAQKTEIDMSDLNSLNIQRFSQTADHIADAQGELAKRQEIFTPATDAARLNKRRLNIEDKKQEGSLIARRIQGDLDHPSIHVGELDDKEKAERMKIANSGADRVNRHNVDDSKDFMASGGSSTVTFAKVKSDGTKEINLNLDAGDTTSRIYRVAFNKKGDDIVSRVDSTKRAIAARAWAGMRANLAADPHALDTNQTARDFFANPHLTYTSRDPNTHVRTTYNGMDATRHMLKDMDIPEEQVTNDEQLRAFAVKLVTSDTLEAARFASDTAGDPDYLSGDDKADAKTLFGENNRAMKQLMDRGTSDKSYVTASVPELDAMNPTLYPAIGATYTPGGGAYGPVAPGAQVNPFGDGREFIIGNTTRPIKENDIGSIQKALKTVNDAMRAAANNQLHDPAVANSVTGGTVLTANTTPSSAQYASALDTLKMAGYPTNHS